MSDPEIGNGSESSPIPGNQTETSSWWGENWDKVILGIGGLIVSGIVGYFSGISAVNRQLSELEILANENHLRIEKMEPSVNQITPIQFEQTRQKDRIEDLERENGSHALVRDFIDIRDDQIKRDTIDYLENLIEEINN